MLKFFIPLLFFAFPGQGTPAETGIPSGLTVEFIRQPGNIPVMDLSPEFSWIVPAEAGFQRAYRIIVSYPATGKTPEKVFWDSGRITSGASAEVGYGGQLLSPGTGYAWKVMIWNEKDQPSPFSAPQYFKTGNPEGYASTGNRFLETLKTPDVFYVSGEESYFADFGKDAFGTLVPDLDFVSDDTILIRMGEKLTYNGAIDRNPGGTIRCQEVILPVKKGRHKYTLPLRKDDRNTGPAAIHLPDSLGVVMPFRYCEIEKCRIPLKKEHLFQKTLWYNFDDNSSAFSSSDTVLNKIWDLCKYTIKATSFAGIYVDGDRERIPYEADAYINQLGHYYTDREYSIARLTNEYFIKHPTWPTEWILHTVPMFYNDFMYTGNIESVKAYYEKLKQKTLISLSGNDGLISSKNCNEQIMVELGFTDPKVKLGDIVDWPPAQKDTGWKLATTEGERDGYEMKEINTVVNAFYIHGLFIMSELAGIVGNRNDSILFRTKADATLKTFNNKLLGTKTGIYVDGEGSEHSSLHANMIPIAFGLVPEENKKNVIAFIKSRGMACSVYGAQYLMEGLYREGEADYALSLLTATNDRSWWNMIRSGSTIALESWDIKYKPNTDWNHAWGAAPANIIPRFLWGIEPAKPGYSVAVIKPQLSSLTTSSVKVPTIRGTIEGSFSSENGKDVFNIIIPGNIDCDFIVPDKPYKTITSGSEKTAISQHKIKLHPGKNILIFYY
jgi:alpha-L-rhamnosidase